MALLSLVNKASLLCEICKKKKKKKRWSVFLLCVDRYLFHCNRKPPSLVSYQLSEYYIGKKVTKRNVFNTFLRLLCMETGLLIIEKRPKNV